MSRQSAPERVRAGTATRRSGARTAQKILDAARELLMSKGHSKFSVRNVAETAGLTLANLQYYFPKRDDLIHAILADTGRRYEQRYAELIADSSDDPHHRLHTIVSFQFNDIFDPATRRFFIQLWALLDSIDPHEGHLLSELYGFDITPLADCIIAIDPAVNKAEAEQRATRIAATVEGLMVVRGKIQHDDPHCKALIHRGVELATHIATGKA